MIEALVERRCVSRARGGALHAEREPPEMLEQIRRTIGDYNFAGQYEQAPAPQGGGMVKAAWLRSYAANERPDPFDRIVQSRDTANRASESQRFQRLHHLGDKRQGPLPVTRAAPAHGIPRAEARGARAVRGLRGERRADRGRGLGHPADPGAGRRRPARRHPLPAAIGQGHADARADRCHRERLCPPPKEAPWLAHTCTS
jgi:hypothetical protein